MNKLSTKISATLTVHNEEENLPECLKNLNFVDEIVIVLDKCTDRSKEIALQFTDRIIEGSWDIEGERRNISIEACKYDWILQIDADERITPELANEIKEAVKNSEPCRFMVPVDNYIGNRLVRYGWLRAWGKSEENILHYKGLKKYLEDRRVHPIADLKGKEKHLKNPLEHYVDRNISDMLVRFNRYTSWRADDMATNEIRNGKMKHGFWYYYKQMMHRFLKSYFAKKGYKEGYFGFVNASLASLYPIFSYCKAREILENIQPKQKRKGK